MATILEFRRKEEEAVPRYLRPEQGSLGEIIIFPGVRIERHVSSDSPTHTEAPSRRRAQRGRKK
jgi:hypothetical protein